jgi:hypothetical protein
MLKVSVIHKESSHQMKRSFCDGAYQMDSVTLLLVCLDHRYAHDSPPGRRRPIPLTQSLSFLPISQACMCFGMAKSSSKKKPHVLNCGQQRYHCLLWNPQCLEYQGCNQVRNPVVAVLCIDSADSC